MARGHLVVRRRPADFVIAEVDGDHIGERTLKGRRAIEWVSTETGKVNMTLVNAVCRLSVILAAATPFRALAADLTDTANHHGRAFVAGTSLPARTVGLGLVGGVVDSTSRHRFVGTLSNADDPQGPQVALNGFAEWAITDRLSWGIFSGLFRYRFGDRGGWEVVPTGGVATFSYTSLEGFAWMPLASLAVRKWLGVHHSVTFSSEAYAALSKTRSIEDDLALTSSFSVNLRPGSMVTINLGVGSRYDGGRPFNGKGPTVPHQWAVEFGGVETIGVRYRPLVQFHITPRFSIDVLARAGWGLDDRSLRYNALGGFSYAW